MCLHGDRPPGIVAVLYSGDQGITPAPLPSVARKIRKIHGRGLATYGRALPRREAIPVCCHEGLSQPYWVLTAAQCQVCTLCSGSPMILESWLPQAATS